MAENTLGRNQVFAIKNADDTPFHDLVLHKATYDSVVMSLGDKITGDVYYKDTSLAVTMKEYIVYNNVRYVLVNPPTIVREGMVANNSELKGMTKYSFTFYHPMYMLGNFPFSDVAVGGETYLSHNKTFAWIGTLADFVAKINSNLIGTEWVCEIGNTVQQTAINKMSDVMSFDKNSIADALKTGYDTWKIPYIIDIISSGDSRYAQDKHFLIRYGLPSEEILDTNNQPYVFRFGKGVGLKNNSRTPRNNKIVTRIVGYGSENNIPYGYPQIVWNGSIDDSRLRYPLYDGIVNGQWAKLIKHPFTRKHLMPSVYTDAVNKKVNPRASGYNPNIELADYYDADSSGGTVYPNPINPNAPSVEIHEFDIKPEFGNMSIVGVYAYEQKYNDAIWPSECISKLVEYKSESDNYVERQQLDIIIEFLEDEHAQSARGKSSVGSYSYEWSITTDESYAYIDYKSSILNFSYIVIRAEYKPSPAWDDTMDEEGNYRQSYFRITLPILSFDLYACASITEQMSINMRSGACKGCTFPVMIDWDDYKKNFYDSDGNFDPVIGDGHHRNSSKYPDSRIEQITVIVQKEYQTFGVLMPNTFQRPYSGDQFVILGISLPQSYITSAEQRLDNEMKQYMLENNVYYFDYPLNFDEHFLATHTSILSQIKPNVVVRFDYNNETIALYVKQMSIKWGQSPLPQYDIVLTDDVEIVLNPIGKVIDDVSKLRTDVESGALIDFDSLAAKLDERYDQRYLSKTDDDTDWGTVRLLKGLQVGEQFVSGLLGSGAVFRNNDDGTTYLEVDKMYVRMRAYFDTLEIRRFIHSGGNRIASLAGIKCSRVEYINIDDEITNDLEEAVKFRCYFRAVDNGNAVTNDFLVGDLAFCKETNASVGEGMEQHGYWRAVVGISSTPENDEHYIDLSKTDCLEDSGIPQAQDDIIQLGNKTDTTRQGAIIEYVGGENAPSYQIYQGINDYSLVSKNYVRFGYNSQTHSAEAYIGNPDGSSYIWYHNVTQGGVTRPQLDIKAVINAQSNIGNKTLDQYIQDAYDTSDIWEAIGDLQSQIDGEIDTWYYEGVPTLNNDPAVNWTTDSDKNNHLGDLYYNKTDGSAYRFVFDEDDNTYKWVEIHDDAVSEALRIANEAKDTADGKRRVFLTDAQHPHPTPPYDRGDLWVNAVWPAAGQQEQGSLYNDEILKCNTTKESGSFSINDWGRASNKFEDWVTNEYADTIHTIGTQVDKKAETWYQGTNPASSWNTNELKAQHVGDLWYCTQDISGTDFKKDTTWRYTDKGQSANPRYVWEQQYVPQSVFDAIDGKNAIYTAWGDWGENLKERDLLIPSSNIPASPQTGNVAYIANKVYRCTNVGNASTPPTFVEISYTDDTVFNNYIQQILNGTDGTSDSSRVAQALHAIKEALLENTTIDGGLILTNLVAMRSSNKVWAGISGQYKAQETGSGWKGHGIAAWYGGGMADWEVYKETHPTETISDSFAQSLFRFDGSGYLAGGNITWDSQGRVAIKDITTLIGGNDTDVLNALTTFNSAFHFNTQQGTGTILSIVPQMPFASLQILENGTANNVATQKWVDDNYVSIGFFNKLFQAYKSTTTTDANKVVPNDLQTTIDNLKIMVGTWTQQYVSALGLNDSGSSGGAQVLDDLLDVTISNPTQGQILKYRVVNGVGGWYNAADESGVGTVTQVKLGNVAYNPTNGVVSLPAYPQTLPASDVPSWAKQAQKPSYTLDEVTDGSTRKLSNYLPLAGGTMTGNVLHKSSTLQRGVAPDARIVMYRSWSDKDNKYLGWFEFVSDTNGDNSIGLYVLSNITTSTNNYGGLKIIKGVGVTDSYVAELNANTGNLSIKTLQSTVATGTAPLTIASTTLVSNLNADLLDGQHASYFATAASLTTANGKITTLEGYFDNGVANSAKRLSGTSSYTAWGRTYWSSGVPQNVSGNIDLNKGEDIRLKDGSNYRRIFGVSSSDNTLLIGWELKSITNSDTTMCAGNNLNIGYGSNVGDTTYGKYWAIFRNNGHFTINANDSSDVFLNVGGATKTTRLYLYKPNASSDTGAVYLEYESANSGIHLVGGGLYADTYVSALGFSGGGGGGASSLAELSDVTLTSPSNGQALIYDNGQWKNGAAGMNMTELTTYLSSKILTVKNGTATLGTWNPTAAGTIDIASALGAYLPLTGGTLSINGIGGFTVKNTSSNYPVIRFEGNTGGGLGFIGIGKTGNVIQPYYVTADANGGYTDGVSQWNMIWHSGNDSELLSSFVNSGDNVSLTVGSTTKTLTVGYSTKALRLKNIVMAAGDDYDTLSGYTADRGSFVATNDNAYTSIPNINDYDTLVSFGYGYRTFQIKSRAYYQTFSYRTVTNPSQGVYRFGDWKTIAFTDSNVASATRLAGTATKSAWGRTYWSNGQPQDISGNIEYTGHITPSASYTYEIGARDNYYRGVYCGYFNLIDPTTNEDFNITWRNTDNKRVLAMYCWETVMSDMILGATDSSYGLYFDGTNGRWGIGTSLPGQRFGSENVGLKLDVAGIARANQLRAYNSAGETMLLNSTTSYDCIVFQINDASKWSVGTDSENNFYWYTQPGGNRTVMYLTSAGVLNVGNSVKCTDLWIGNIHITYDSTNGGIHVANGGLSANTYVSALGVGQEGGGTQGLDIEAMWTELATPNTARQIDSSHISNALSNYVTTNTLSGYATQQWVNSQGFAYASSLSNYVSAVSMSSGQLNVTKGGTTTSTDIMALRLGQSALGNSASLATFTHSTDLIYTAKGGGNTVTDKPTGVDAFGVLSLKTAGGYYGQILLEAGGELYVRSSNSLSGGWRKQLDSSNWSGVVTLSALGGASTVALTEATTRISTLEGYFNAGGVAKKAAVLNTARTINGTNFDGSASITTRSWGTSRTITIADHDSSNTHANNGIDGSENITLYLPSTIKATLNGNASSATTATTASKLSTVSKTAWGQTYWTSGGVPTDVSGSIEAGNSGGYIGGFDHIDLNTHASLYGYGGYIDFYYNGANSYTSRIIEKESGVLSINAPNVAGLLVGGYNGDYVQIGQIRIVYESSNNALRIENANNGGAANLYAMGGISALGMSGNADGTVSGNLTPSTSDTYTLGSSSARWKALYLGYSSSRTLEIKPTSYDIGFNSSGSTQFTFNNDMEVGGDLYVNDHLGVGDTNTNYALYVYGTAYITGNISAASVTNRSDMRMKNFVENINLKVDAIAEAPSFKFTFKDGNSRLMVGTSAQFWDSVLPESVFRDADGMLGLDYGVTALVSVISVARKVVTHEERIKALEEENERLRNEVEQLKAA